MHSLAASSRGRSRSRPAPRTWRSAASRAVPAMSRARSAATTSSPARWSASSRRTSWSRATRTRCCARSWTRSRRPATRSAIPGPPVATGPRAWTPRASPPRRRRCCSSRAACTATTRSCRRWPASQCILLAGVDVGILGSREMCCGGRWAGSGHRAEFERMAVRPLGRRGDEDPRAGRHLRPAPPAQQRRRGRLRPAAGPAPGDPGRAARGDGADPRVQLVLRGAGGGCREAMPEYSAWTAGERIEEAAVATGAEALVTACGWCERNFLEPHQRGRRADRRRGYARPRRARACRAGRSRPGPGPFRSGHPMTVPTAVLDELRGIVGPRHYSDDAAILDTYRYSLAHTANHLGPWYGSRTPRGAAVVLPGTVEEVQEIVRLCNRERVRYKASTTFWSAQGYPSFDDTVQLDMRRMDRVPRYPDARPPRTCHAGIMAKALIDERVMLEAQRMLVHGDGPVATIAGALGFDDPPRTSRSTSPSARGARRRCSAGAPGWRWADRGRPGPPGASDASRRRGRSAHSVFRWVTPRISSQSRTRHGLASDRRPSSPMLR